MMLMGVDINNIECDTTFVEFWAWMYAGRELTCCCVLVPGCRIGTKGAKALALELGYLGQLTVLNLTGECYNGW